MKVSSLSLTETDLALLGELYTSQYYRPLKKLLEGWRLETALLCARTAANMEQVSYHRGKDAAALELHTMLKDNHNEIMKKENA